MAAAQVLVEQSTTTGTAAARVATEESLTGDDLEDFWNTPGTWTQQCCNAPMQMLKKVHLVIIGKPVVQWYNNDALLHHGLIPRLMVMTKTRLVVFIVDLIIFSVIFMVMTFVVKGRFFSLH